MDFKCICFLIMYFQISKVMCRRYKQTELNNLIFIWSPFVLRISDPASMMTSGEGSQSVSLDDSDKPLIVLRSVEHLQICNCT